MQIAYFANLFAKVIKNAVCKTYSGTCFQYIVLYSQKALYMFSRHCNNFKSFLQSLNMFMGKIKQIFQDLLRYKTLFLSLSVWTICAV